MMEPIRPSVWRSAKRNTALRVRAVRIASGEYQGCPPRVVRGSAVQAAIASSVNQTVKLPRCRKLASYSRQFVTVCFWRGMWCRPAWFSLKGKEGVQGQTRAALLRHPASQHQPDQPADPCNTALLSLHGASDAAVMDVITGRFKP